MFGSGSDPNEFGLRFATVRAKLVFISLRSAQTKRPPDVLRRPPDVMRLLAHASVNRTSSVFAPLRSAQGGFYMQGHTDSAIFLYGNGYERIQKLYF